MNSVQWANVFHAQLTTTSSISASDLTTWLTSQATFYKSRFQQYQNSTVNYVLAKAIVYTPGGTQVNAQIGMTGSGASAGTAVSDQSAAAVVSWTSNVYWRGGKPRSYIPGLVTTNIQNNSQLTAAFLAALQASANSYRSDVNSATNGTIATTTFGFISFFSGNQALVPGVFHPIAGAVVHPRLGSQRRRLGRWAP